MSAIKDNLIAGGAYSLIMKAVIVTFVITVIAWLVATAVGAVCGYFMCYRQRAVTMLAEGFCFLFRATPVLLMLLFLYYGVFGSVNVNGMLLAGLAIGLYGGGHFAEILMKTIRESEDWKSREMRRRLRAAFFTAALPHATGVSLFQMKRLCIQLLQWSTVVGYIGVNDLTEVMLTIGQRNMAPFFGIAFSILLYLVATVLIEVVFAWIGKRFFGVEEQVEEQEVRGKDKRRPMKRSDVVLSEEAEQEESAQEELMQEADDEEQDAGLQRSVEQNDYIKELLQK